MMSRFHESVLAPLVALLLFALIPLLAHGQVPAPAGEPAKDSAAGTTVSFGAASAAVDAGEFEKHYGSTTERMMWLRDQHIPEMEWPLLFETVKAGKADIVEVVSSRQGHKTWPEILQQYGVTAQQLALPSIAQKQPGAEDQLIRGAAAKFLIAVSERPPGEVANYVSEHDSLVVNFAAVAPAEQKSDELKQEEGKTSPIKEVPAIVPGSDPRTAPGIDNRPNP